MTTKIHRNDKIEYTNYKFLNKVYFNKFLFIDYSVME